MLQKLHILVHHSSGPDYNQTLATPFFATRRLLIKTPSRAATKSNVYTENQYISRCSMSERALTLENAIGRIHKKVRERRAPCVGAAKRQPKLEIAKIRPVRALNSNCKEEKTAQVPVSTRTQFHSEIERAIRAPRMIMITLINSGQNCANSYLEKMRQTCS